MEYVINSKTDKFAIYGAGNLGRVICDHLMSQGFGVAYFLDKNANELTTYREIPVIAPEQLQPGKPRSEMIVVALTNRFLQEQTAAYLFDLGYKRIIYKKDILGAESRYKFNEIYDAIMENAKIQGSIAEEYDPDDAKSLSFGNGIIERKEDEVIVHLPTDLLFVEGEPIYNKTFVLDLFESFAMGGDDKTDEYYAYAAGWRNRVLSEQPDKANWRKKKADCIADRYAIFQKMSQALASKPQFFIEHPVLASKSKGVFEIKDGLHRAAFLLTKGFRCIPCKISLSDYNSWVNESAFEKAKNYVRDNEILVLPAPVAHPGFLLFPVENDDVYRTRYDVICRYLKKQNIKMDSMQVLDISLCNGHYARLFSKAGATAVFFSENEKEREAAGVFNDLLGCKNISLAGNINEAKALSADVCLNLCRIFDEKRCKAELVASNYFFIETEDETRLEQIVSKTGFSFYDILHRTVLNGQMNFLAVLRR